MLAMYAVSDQYPLGLVGVSTGKKVGNKTIHTGDVVGYKDNNGRLNSGIVVNVSNKITIEGTVGRLLSESNVTSVLKSYKEFRDREVSNSGEVIFIKLNV